MNIAILGDGRLGTEIGAVLGNRSGIRPLTLGRPPAGRTERPELAGIDLVFEASTGPAVAANIDAALAAGVRRFVIATTAWSESRPAVERALGRAGACAVASPNFSLGVALFFRLVDAAARLYGPIAAFEPYVVEWHHAAKADRPSGTALELSRRIVAVRPGRPPLAKIASLRAGSAPGTHLVGFDAPAETLELRLTARNRSAYAAGAVEAGDWLGAGPRSAGIHSFDEVLDDLLAGSSPSSARRTTIQ
ncbi:MAG: dihydrodipicolinate reductase C-terminal domain-containing protein [Candidatus Limnocylindrales bacterium]